MSARVIQSMTHKELMEGHFPKPDDLVDQILVEGGAAVWSALWGTGKTWLALELSRAVASGSTFLCHFPTKQGKVVYLDQEGHPGGHKERMQLLDRSNPIGDDLDIVFKYLSGAHLTDVDGFLAVDRILTEEKPALVVLDSWVRFFRGKENDPIDVAAFNETVRSLRLTHGCTVDSLDHIRKRPLGGATDHPEDRTRGSGEKLAGVDNGLTVETSRDDKGILMAYPIKTRWGEGLPPFKIRFGACPDSGGVRLRWMGEASADEVKSELGKPVLVAQAIGALKEQWGADAATITTIQGYLDWSESVTRRIVRDMVKAGLLVTRDAPSVGGRKATVYDLPERD